MLLSAAVSTGGETPRNDVRDAAIVDRLARGEADAVADLYDRHARMVYSLVLRILRDDANAEDVVQEVFVQAWQQAARYSVVHGTVPAWLLAIARGRALARLRTPEARSDRAAAGFDAAMPPPAAAGDLAAPLLASEDALMLRRASTSRWLRPSK
jgi:RNA polymerase sigma-70 factor, ECF subfamily